MNGTEQKNFELDEILKDVRTIAVSGHVRPDGDCVGSCVGLYLYLKRYYPQKEVRLFLDHYPESFGFLAGTDEICHEADEETVFDIFFALDCADAGRLGYHAPCFKNAKTTVCIDHHISNRVFTDYYYTVPTASSTSELICLLTGTDSLDREMAEALYLGIVHDTGVFQYSCTSSRTMRIAGELMDKGIDYPEIVRKTFFMNSYRKQQILGRALMESVRLLDGRIIFSAMRMKDMAFYQADSRDLEGIVSELRNTEGVDVSIFLHETQPQIWKVSLRSSEAVDVSRVCEYFGGGGHARAAGCSLQGSMHDVINNLTKHIVEQMKDGPEDV